MSHLAVCLSNSYMRCEAQPDSPLRERRESLNFGSDYGYAWPDAIQIKGSVCHLNRVDLIAQGLCITADMPMVFGSTLTLPTFIFFFTFFQAYVLPLWVSVRLDLGFIFYIYFISATPTALSSCVTVTSQVAYK